MADLSSLLQLSQQMQGRLTESQTQLAQQTLTVSAGGGMVQATVDGRGHIRGITIDPQVVRQGDVEMLEDLVLAAVAEAQMRAAELYQAEVRKLASGMPFPFQLPPLWAAGHPVSATEELMAERGKRPGIGRKTAQRLTFHLLKQPPEAAERLAEAIRRVRGQVVACGTCGNLADEDPCPICRDPRRDATLLCVVEESGDVGAIERAARYRGLYHVLGDRKSVV